MVDHNIAPHPINYALWYNYVSNRNPVLNQELDRIISTTGTCDAKHSRELYQKYIINDELENHYQTLDTIAHLAANIMNSLSETISGSESFGDTLVTHIGKLKDASTIGEVSQVIDAVMSTANQINDANRKFHQAAKKNREEVDKLKHELQQVEKQTFTDSLTQVFNRYAFDKQLGQLLQTPQIAEHAYLVMIDLDHFKSFNDEYGHLIGDRILQLTGQLLQDYCPDNAIVARYGGEEFAVILNNSTMSQANEVAETLRQRLEMLRVKLRDSDKMLDHITASFGVTRFNLGESIDSFIERADKALYQAKDNGRNRVEIGI